MRSHLLAPVSAARFGEFAGTALSDVKKLLKDRDPGVVAAAKTLVTRLDAPSK